MQEAGITTAKDRLIAERDRLKQQVEQIDHRLLEIHADIAAIERVCDILGKGEQSDQDAPSSANGRRGPRGRLIREIRAIIAGWPIDKDFTSVLIRSTLQERDPVFAATVHNSSIPTTMKNLAELGEVDLLREGAGRRPGVYVRAHPDITIVRKSRTANPKGVTNDM